MHKDVKKDFPVAVTLNIVRAISLPLAHINHVFGAYTPSKKLVIYLKVFVFLGKIEMSLNVVFAHEWFSSWNSVM